VIDDGTITGQLAEASATSEDGEHLVQTDYSKFIYLEGVLMSCQQASAYLQLGEWTNVLTTCGEPDCLLHLTTLTAAKEEEDIALVTRHAVSLADLYRAGRSRGLLAARTEYGG
jgi:hypothetical protein